MNLTELYLKANPKPVKPISLTLAEQAWLVSKAVDLCDALRTMLYSHSYGMHPDGKLCIDCKIVREILDSCGR